MVFPMSKNHLIFTTNVENQVTKLVKNHVQNYMNLENIAQVTRTKMAFVSLYGEEALSSYPLSIRSHIDYNPNQRIAAPIYAGGC